MYQSKLVASLKANGKILREFKDTVYIPFGSEYSILLKNLNTQRAVVNIFLDGENAVPDGLVIDPGREVDLERWIKNGNLSEGNRFKFIERTENIENGPRGIKLEDGLVRIEFQFEKPRPVFNTTQLFANNSTPYYPPGVRTSQFRGSVDKFTLKASGSTSQMNVGSVLRGVDYSQGMATTTAASAAINAVVPQTSELHAGAAAMDWNDVGITVPGSKSNQRFSEVTMGLLETETHTIVLKLAGDLGHNKPVTKPVTVKAKPKCITCGKQNKATAHFCSECGTALEIFA